MKNLCEKAFSCFSNDQVVSKYGGNLVKEIFGSEKSKSHLFYITSQKQWNNQVGAENSTQGCKRIIDIGDIYYKCLDCFEHNMQACDMCFNSIPDQHLGHTIQILRNLTHSHKLCSCGGVSVFCNQHPLRNQLVETQVQQTTLNKGEQHINNAIKHVMIQQGLSQATQEKEHIPLNSIAIVIQPDLIPVTHPHEISLSKKIRNLLGLAFSKLSFFSVCSDEQINQNNINNYEEIQTKENQRNLDLVRFKIQKIILQRVQKYIKSNDTEKMDLLLRCLFDFVCSKDVSKGQMITSPVIIQQIIDTLMIKLTDTNRMLQLNSAEDCNSFNHQLKSNQKAIPPSTGVGRLEDGSWQGINQTMNVLLKQTTLEMRFLEIILSTFCNRNIFGNLGSLKGSIRSMLKRRTAIEIGTLMQLLDKGLSRLFEYVRDPKNLRQNRRNIISIICAFLKVADLSQPTQANTVLHALRQSTLADSTGISPVKNYQNTYFLEQLNWLILKSTCSNPHMTPQFLEKIAHEFHFELHTLPNVSCYEIPYPQHFPCNTAQQLRIYLLVCTLLALTPAYYPKLNTPRPKAATYTRSRTILLQNVPHSRSQSQPQQNSKQTSNTSTPSTMLKQNNNPRTGGTLSTLYTPQGNDNTPQANDNNMFIPSYMDLQQQQQQQNDNKHKDNNINKTNLVNNNGRPPFAQNTKQKEFLLKIYKMDEFYSSQNSPYNNNSRDVCNNDNQPNRQYCVHELAEVRNAADEESNNIIDDNDFPDLRATILQSSDSARKNRYNFTDYNNENNECALSPPPLLHQSSQDKTQSPLQSPVKSQVSSGNNIPEIPQEKRNSFNKQTTNNIIQQKGMNLLNRQNSSGSAAIATNSSALLSAQNSANSTTTENNNNNNNNSNSAINNSNNTNQNNVSFFQNTILYSLQKKNSSSSSSLPSHLVSTVQQSLAISSKVIQKSLPENSLSNIPCQNSVNQSQFQSLTNKLNSNTISTTAQINSTYSDNTKQSAQIVSANNPNNQIVKQTNDQQSKIITSALKNNKQSGFKLSSTNGVSLPEIDGTLEKLQDRQTAMHPKIVENFLQHSFLLKAKHNQTMNKIDWMTGCEWFLVQFWASSIAKEDFIRKIQSENVEDNHPNHNNCSNNILGMTKRSVFSTEIIVALLKESHELCFRSKFFKIVKSKQYTEIVDSTLNLNNINSYYHQDSQQLYNTRKKLIVREYSDVKRRSTLIKQEDIDLNNCGNYEPSNNSSRMEELLKKVIMSLVISQSPAAGVFNNIQSEQIIGQSQGCQSPGIFSIKSFRLTARAVFQFLKQTLQLDLSAVSDCWFRQFLELDWRTNALYPQESQIFYDPFFLPSLHGSRYFTALNIASTVFLNNKQCVEKKNDLVKDNTSEIESNFEQNTMKSPILSSSSGTLCDQIFGICTPQQQHMVILFENTLSLDLIPLLTSTYNLPQNILVPAIKAALQILYNCDEYEEEEKIKLSTSRLIAFIEKIRPEVIASSIKRSLVQQLEKQTLYQKGQTIRNQQYDVNSPRYFKDNKEKVKKLTSNFNEQQQLIDETFHLDNDIGLGNSNSKQQPQNKELLSPAKMMQDKMLAEIQRKQNMFAQKIKTNKEQNYNTTTINNNNLALKDIPVNCRDCNDVFCQICGETYLKRKVILISCFISTNKDFNNTNARSLETSGKNQVHCNSCSHFVHKQCVNSFVRTGNHYERLLKENEFFCCSCLRLSNFFIPFLQQFEKQIAFNYDHDKGGNVIKAESEIQATAAAGGGNNQRKLKERLTVQVDRDKRINKRLEPLRIEQITKDAKRVEIIDNEEDVVEEESSPMKLLKNTPNDIAEVTAKPHKIIRQKSSTQQIQLSSNPLILQSVIRTTRCNSQGKKKIVKSKDKGQKQQQEQHQLNEYEWLRENESNQSGNNNNNNNHQTNRSKIKSKDIFCFPSSQLENLENTKNELKHESPMDQLSVTSDKHNFSQNNLPLKHNNNNFQDSLFGEGVIFEERKESTTLCESDKTLMYFFESEVDISYLEDMQMRMSHLGLRQGQFLEWCENILVDQMQDVIRMGNYQVSSRDYIEKNAEQQANNDNSNENNNNGQQFQSNLTHENFTQSKQFTIMHNLILSIRIWLLVEDRDNYLLQYRQLHAQFIHMIQTDMNFIYKIARTNNDFTDQNQENVSFIRAIARLCLLFALDPDTFLAISAKFLFRYLLIDIAIMKAKEFSELDALPDPKNFLEELQQISLIQSADSRFVSILYCFYMGFYGPANGIAIRAFLYSLLNVPQKESSSKNTSFQPAKPRLFSSQKIEPTVDRMTQSVPQNLYLVKSAPNGSLEEANSEPSDGVSGSYGSQFRIAKQSSNVLLNASTLNGNAYSTVFLTVSSAFIETITMDIIDDLFFAQRREVFNRFKNYKKAEYLRTQNISTLPQTFSEFISCYFSAKCAVCKQYPKSISHEQQGYYFCLLCKVNICSKHNNNLPFIKNTSNHHNHHHHSSSSSSAHKITNSSPIIDKIVLSLPEHSKNQHYGTCIFLDFFNANIIIVREGETFLDKQLALYRDSIGRGPQENSQWRDEVKLCTSAWKEILNIISKREIDQRCMQIKRVQLDDMLDAEQAALRERARQDENNHISTILIPPQANNNNNNNLSFNQQHNHQQNQGISQLISPDIQFNRTLTSPQIRPTRFFHINNINNTPNTNNPSSFNSTQALHLNNLPSSQQNFSSHFFTTLNL